jgi:glycosyltransferase involved in cell wall biosynthesis
MNSPSVSIVIPTYNRGHLISRAIESIIKQTFNEWELIVVDDGSTDNTEDAVRTFSSDQRVKYFRKENSGAAESRNAGVARATSRYITFLDSDDEAEPFWLERMLHTLESNAASVVCCGLTRIDANGKLISSEMPKSLAPIFKSVKGRFTNGGVYLMETSIFHGIGGFDPELRSGQHTELSFRLIPYLEKNGLQIANIFESLIKVYVHDGPRIRHDVNAIFLGSSRTLEKHAELFKRDKARYADYLSVAGVYGIRLKKYKESNAFFRQAVVLRPFSIQGWVRLIIANIPILRDRVWKIQNERN